MSDKIVVPAGMLKAAEYAFMVPLNVVCHEYPLVVHILKNQLPVALEAALRWLSENPIVPTNEQTQGVCDSIFVGPENLLDPRDAMVEWQRRMRMFLATEPEIPEEIKDLLSLTDPITGVALLTGLTEHGKSVIIEAYRRGQKAGAK